MGTIALKSVQQVEVTTLMDNYIDILLERILTNVRLFFNADAGSIYMKNGDELKFSYSQNNTLQKKLPSGRKAPPQR